MKRMKTWLAVVLSLVMMAAALPMTAVTAEEAVTYYLKDCADKVKLIGRTEVTDMGIVPHTTASGFAFYTDAGGDIEITVTGSSAIFDAQYFLVYVDGEIGNRLTLSHPIGRQKTATFTAAEGLSEGMHRIEIYRETEEINAKCTINSLVMRGNMTPVPEAPMMIEFVGDSITTGYGAYPVTAESEAKGREDHPIRQAGTKSYAFLTAAALGTDFQACCTSGYGVEVGYNADGVNMQDMYEKTAFHHDPTALWGFERQADIVVINMGTNDSGARLKDPNNIISEKQIVAGMENLISIVKTHNPDAKIVWCTGLMGPTFEFSTKLMLRELGGESAGYYFCKLPRGTSGGGGHPDESEHRAAADVLIEFLKNTVLGDDYADGYVTVDDARALAEGGTLSDEYAAKLALEVTIAEKSGDVDGILDGMYRDALANGAKPAVPPTTTQTPATSASRAVTTAATDESDDGDMLWLWIVLAVVVAAAVGGVIVFAVVYQPKKSEDTSEKTVTEKTEEDAQ